MQNASVVDLKRALDAFRKVGRFHRSAGYPWMNPPGSKLKQLALAVEPKATVHRTAAGKYECRINGKAMHRDGGTHSTPHQAWECISRHLTAGVVLDGHITNTDVLAETSIAAIAASVGAHTELRQEACKRECAQ